MKNENDPIYLVRRPKTVRNDPTKRGMVASNPVKFADGRYVVAAVHTRFSAVEWFVGDLTQLDADDLPKIIRQARTFEQAIAGLGTVERVAPLPPDINAVVPCPDCGRHIEVIASAKRALLLRRDCICGATFDITSPHIGVGAKYQPVVFDRVKTARRRA